MSESQKGRMGRRNNSLNRISKIGRGERNQPKVWERKKEKLSREYLKCIISGMQNEEWITFRAKKLFVALAETKTKTKKRDKKFKG